MHTDASSFASTPPAPPQTHIQVYSCTPKGNPNYTFRESIPLGVTSISTPQV
jgi:hypothetical protein